MPSARRAKENFKREKETPVPRTRGTLTLTAADSRPKPVRIEPSRV